MANMIMIHLHMQKAEAADGPHDLTVNDTSVLLKELLRGLTYRLKVHKFACSELILHCSLKDSLCQLE